MIVSGLVKYQDDLEPLMVPIDSVSPHPENYNMGDVEEIALSIEINGMYRPIQVQRSTGYITSGNHTWEACKLLDAQIIPVVHCEWTDEEAIREMVADNEIARKARRDAKRLVDLLQKIRKTDIGLQGSGLKEEDLTVLSHLADMDAEPLEFATWPSITFTVHPRIRKAFMHITREADTDPDRFELLLRLAGWDGK